jgi:hypothetical protein
MYRRRLFAFVSLVYPSATIKKQDEKHRRQVRELLARGALHTGKDFERAAFIFQHGSTPEGYLLAHSLALVAMARGNAGALWLATATLDRYLNSIKQPQIYGTQFHNTKETGWSQEPYNRTLISDELRRRLGVHPRPHTESNLKNTKRRRDHRFVPSLSRECGRLLTVPGVTSGVGVPRQSKRNRMIHLLQPLH